MIAGRRYMLADGTIVYSSNNIPSDSEVMDIGPYQTSLGQTGEFKFVQLENREIVIILKPGRTDSCCGRITFESSLTEPVYQPVFDSNYPQEWLFLSEMGEMITAFWDWLQDNHPDIWKKMYFKPEGTP